MAIDVQSRITSVEQLEALYGQPSEASIVKEVDWITPHYRAMIEASAFAVLGTSGPEGSTARRAATWRASCASPTSARCCCPTGAATTARTRCATSCATRAWRCCSSSLG